MGKSTVVIGLGIFGREIAVSLSKRGHSVLAVDTDAELVEAIKDQVDQAMILDTTDEGALYEAKIEEFEAAVCAIGAQHIQDSILTTALLHQMGVPRIIARASDDLHARILRQVGATEVLNPERQMGWRIANQISSPGIREVLRLARDVCIAEVPVPSSFVGETPVGLDIRKKYGVTIIGVHRATSGGEGESQNVGGEELEGTQLMDGTRQLILNMEPDDIFMENDNLVVIGHEKDVQRLNGLA